MKYGSHGENYDVNKLKIEVARLIADDDVTKASGVYEYVFDHQERHLHIRAFSKRDRKHLKGKKGKCPICPKKYIIEEMEADHIKPWSKDGHTAPQKFQCLCRECNRKKGCL